MALIYDATFDSQTRVLSLLDKAGNVISSCEVPSKEPLVDDITKPLTFRAKQDGSKVALIKVGSPTGSFQTSRDGGSTWVNYALNTNITLNTGDEVSFRARSNRTTKQTPDNYFYFKMEGKIEAWHNVISLYRTYDFATYMSVAVVSAFYRLFRKCTSLTKAPALPATTLASECYASMFSGCTSLTEAPALPATTLTTSCYMYMFWGCTSLIKAPVLPATTLTTSCYKEMFNGCSNLNEVHCHIPSSYSSSNISSYAENWLNGVSSTGTFYTNADANWTSGTSGIPTGWNRVPAVDDPNKPLMLRAIEDNSSVTLTKVGTLSNTYQTSNDGINWTDYTLGTEIPLNNEDVVYFRRRNHPTLQDTSKHVQFVMTGKIEAWHNAYSMVSSSFTNTEDSVGRFGMCNLFNNCKSLTKAPLLVNTVVEERCYQSMFEGCTSLTQAPPSLPATNLANYCYLSMFRGCTSLTQAPALPATNLAINCYQNMFTGCTSLAQAPALPATNLANYCYLSMFSDCTSLTKAPALPATNLANYCYLSMFSDCTSLTKAPALPATNLTEYCYAGMFGGCTSLNEVRISATRRSGINQLDDWLKNVSATGDFYCDPNATIFPTGVSGIPKGWTRKPLSDYPVTP